MTRTVVAVALLLWIVATPGRASQQDALARLREALGGEIALSAVRTLRVRSTIDRKRHKDHVEVALALPDRFFRTVRYVSVPERRWPARDYDVHDLNMSRMEPIVNPGGSDEPGVVMSGF